MVVNLSRNNELCLHHVNTGISEFESNFHCMCIFYKLNLLQFIENPPRLSFNTCSQTIMSQSKAPKRVTLKWIDSRRLALYEMQAIPSIIPDGRRESWNKRDASDTCIGEAQKQISSRILSWIGSRTEHAAPLCQNCNRRLRDCRSVMCSTMKSNKNYDYIEAS